MCIVEVSSLCLAFNYYSYNVLHFTARKTRCDAARPECGNCARRSLMCSYIHTQPSQPRSKGKKAAAAAAKEEAARNAAKANLEGGPNPGGVTTTGTGTSTAGEGTPSASASAPGVISPTRRHSPGSGSQHSGGSHAHEQGGGGEWQQTAARGVHSQNAPHAHTRAHAHAANVNSRGHVHAHGHGHGHGHVPGGHSSHTAAAAPESPMRMDDRLIEESAERDRPLTRSPTGPPIATLPAGSPSAPSSPTSASPHGLRHEVSPYTNGKVSAYVHGGGGVEHEHDEHEQDGAAAGQREGTPVGDMRSSQSRSNSVGTVEAAVMMRAGKRKSPPMSDGDVERSDPDDRRPEKKRTRHETAEDASGDESCVDG